MMSTLYFSKSVDGKRYEDINFLRSNEMINSFTHKTWYACELMYSYTGEWHTSICPKLIHVSIQEISWSPHHLFSKNRMLEKNIMLIEKIFYRNYNWTRLDNQEKRTISSIIQNPAINQGTSASFIIYRQCRYRKQHSSAQCDVIFFKMLLFFQFSFQN